MTWEEIKKEITCLKVDILPRAFLAPYSQAEDFWWRPADKGLSMGLKPVLAAVKVQKKRGQWERKQTEDEEERKETGFYEALEVNHYTRILSFRWYRSWF